MTIDWDIEPVRDDEFLPPCKNCRYIEMCEYIGRDECLLEDFIYGYTPEGFDDEDRPEGMSQAEWLKIREERDMAEAEELIIEEAIEQERLRRLEDG